MPNANHPTEKQARKFEAKAPPGGFLHLFGLPMNGPAN
jgi:hypothetical protein